MPMVTTTVQIQKWGNSHGIRLPKKIITSLKWQQGAELSLSVNDNKLLIEQVSNNHQNIKELFKDFNSDDYKPSEIYWGAPVGRELW